MRKSLRLRRLVVGVDRNPLAVLSARVNYLMAVADLVLPNVGVFVPRFIWVIQHSPHPS